MHRIDSSTATPDGRFTEGNPTIPVPATTVTADWLNAMQEEKIAVLTAAGIAPDKANNAQMLAAILKLIADKVITPDDLTTVVDDHGVFSIVGTRSPYTVPVAISPDAPLSWLPFERPMTADVDLYVSTTGNDGNDGSAAAPVATIAQALVLTRRYRRSPYKCIIHVAAGTYPGDFTVDFSRDYPVISIVGAGAATILPNIYAIFAGRLYVSSLTITKTSAGNGEILLSGSLGASVYADSVIVTVGGVAASAVGASYGGSLTLTKSTLNTSGTAFSIVLARGGYVFLLSTAITTNATVASGWAQADSNGLISTQGCTFAGNVTGPRYAASLNGVISTNGAGATYFPGSAAGNTFAGGQYS